MREVMPPKTARETLAPDFWMRQFAQFLRPTLRFVCTGGDQWAESGQDQRLIGAAPRARDPCLEIGIEDLRARLLHLRRENGLGMARRKTTARVRRPGLDEDRPPLRTARQVQWPGHAVIGALVVEGPNACRVGVVSASA